MKLHVYSEIGTLKKVLLHRPGEEVENLTPNLMERLLFDDIPYLKVAQQEHDAFAEVFKQNGVEVYYLETLLGEALQDKGVRDHFTETFIDEAGLKNRYYRAGVKALYASYDNPKEMVEKMIAGVRRDEIGKPSGRSLASLIECDYPFVVDPLPNLYFTRDPFSTVGQGVSLHKMRTVTRRRETIFSKFLFEHHPHFKSTPPSFWYRRENLYPIEGGDILILSDKLIAIGVSQRTDPDAVEQFAQAIFSSEEPFETILAFDIPKTRAFMHLDTVFTMVDHTTFTIHPDIEGPLSVYSLKKTDGSGAYSMAHEREDLERILSKYLDVDSVTLLRCGGGHPIDAGREQWNDGSNTLAIAPGEVIVYGRNHVTNALLRDAGVTLHEIPSSELSRGRGGPRCMSMPLYRERV